jgi:hypothetical protein
MDWVAVASSATLAAIAIAVSLRALRHSRRSAAAAERSADAGEKSADSAAAAVAQARRSAEAAEAQARAATEQVEILREQIAEQQAEKNRPQFEVIPPAPSVGESTLAIDIMMVAGTDLGSVAITVTGKDVLGVAGDPASQIRGGRTIVRHDFIVGSRTTVWVDLREVLATSISVQIDCEAPDGQKWSLLPMTVPLMHPTIRNHQR